MKTILEFYDFNEKLPEHGELILWYFPPESGTRRFSIVSYTDELEWIDGEAWASLNGLILLNLPTEWDIDTAAEKYSRTGVTDDGCEYTYDGQSANDFRSGAMWYRDMTKIYINENSNS